MHVIHQRFFKGAGFSSRLIEWMSAGPFSHVATVWSATELLDSRSDVLMGVPAGVQIRKSTYERYVDPVDMVLEVDRAQESRYRKFLVAQINKPYDKPGILGFAFGRNWREEDSWFCSELQCAALENAGILPKLYAPANKITPTALATILSALGAKVLKP